VTICALPGCNIPVPENGSGRPRDYCCDAHRQIAFRFVRSYCRRSGLVSLLANMLMAAAAWQSLNCRYDYDQWLNFRAAMNAIAAHPLVGSRLPTGSGAAVPSSQPLPGAAHTPSPESAGQGGEVDR